VAFDVLGRMHYGGFQLRLMAAGVTVDLNVYYPSPLDAATGHPTVAPTTACTSDGSRTTGGVSPLPYGWWCATFYEAAAQRKHGMYRYHFTPAAIEAMEVCEVRGASPDAPVRRVLLPPRAYLDQYFGPSWRTPVKYTYEEALARGEYRNMIPE
jgi:hypothetical protein